MDSIIVLMLVGTWITAIVAVGGALVNSRRNGRTQVARDQELNDNLRNIAGKVSEHKQSLKDIDARLHGIEINLAGYAERLGVAENEIKELRSKRQ